MKFLSIEKRSPVTICLFPYLVKATSSKADVENSMNACYVD